MKIRESSISEMSPKNYLMKYFDEMSDAEIAQLLGVSRDSLRSRVNRARRKLGALLQEVESDDQ